MSGRPEPTGGDRPAWASRLRQERLARRWSQADAVRALRAHSSEMLPSEDSVLRSLKRWEAGTSEPDDFYRPLLARTYGTVTAALFPGPERAPASFGMDGGLLAAAGMDTMEIITRLHATDITVDTLTALGVTVERLCSAYPHTPSHQLLGEGRQWLARLTELLGHRLTLSQHRDVLHMAGYLALLVGCVENDINDPAASEATRRAALSLGRESGSSDIEGWAHEMKAWHALTRGDFRTVISAADAGQRAAGSHGVTVQLAAQKAKAWARIGDRRQSEVALEHGRTLLESLPHPDNLDHHFVVDPAKYDFYAMDCYRVLREDELARTYAYEVIRNGTDATGRQRSPMRIAEARVTLGVVAARAGDIDEAVHHGHAALTGTRQSLPSLLMAAGELAHLLSQHHDRHPAVAGYNERLHQLQAG